MRLISQDGRIDIPYENNVVYVCANYGYNKDMKYVITGYKIVIFVGYDDSHNLGDYSTKEKALKVIEEIREHYQKLIDFDYSAIKGIKDRPSIYYYMPQDNEVHV